MKTIHLYGHMQEKFGGPFKLDVVTAAEAVRALCVQLTGFEEALRNSTWQVVRGLLDEGDEVCEESLSVSLGRQTELHLIPQISGANSGVGMFITGAILIAAAFFTGGAAIAAWGAAATMMGAAGLGMAVGGLIMSTTKVPAADMMGASTPTDQRASFLFDGPVNQTKQGGAVPRGYGRLKVGSIVISQGLYAEKLPIE